MITFSILALTLLLLIAFIVFSVSVLGATGIVLFSDIIVCIVFIVMLIKFIIKRRKKINRSPQGLLSFSPQKLQVL